MTTKTIDIGKGYRVTVDAADWSDLVDRPFYAVERKGQVLARRSMTLAEVQAAGQRRTVLMAQSMLGVPQDTYIDFIDGDSLNLSRANLRILTTREMCVRERDIRALTLTNEAACLAPTLEGGA